MKKTKKEAPEMKKNITLIVAIVLGVLLLGALGYIGYDIYKKNKEASEQAVYESGYQLGYETALTAIISETAACKTVPLQYNNRTLTLLAAECIQQPQ